jgi:hypothetical protein
LLVVRFASVPAIGLWARRRVPKVWDWIGAPNPIACAPARDVAGTLAKANAFAQSCCDRKRIKMLSAHLKRILRLGRLRFLRLRGPGGAQFEFTLQAPPRTCTALPNWWRDRHPHPQSPRVLRERRWR